MPTRTSKTHRRLWKFVFDDWIQSKPQLRIEFPLYDKKSEVSNSQLTNKIAYQPLLPNQQYRPQQETCKRTKSELQKLQRKQPEEFMSALEKSYKNN